MFISKDLYIARAGRKGRGVFAKKRFRKGETIEISPYILIPPKDARNLTNSIINSYWFDLKKQWSALGLGYTSLYNHNEDPNAEFELNMKKKTITIKALKTIQPHEEITTNYGYELD